MCASVLLFSRLLWRIHFMLSSEDLRLMPSVVINDRIND